MPLPPVLIEQALVAGGVINAATTPAQAWAALLATLETATMATGTALSQSVLAAELSAGTGFAQHVAARVANLGLAGAQGQPAVGLLSESWRIATMAQAGGSAAAGAGAAETAIVATGETAAVSQTGAVTSTLARIGGLVGLEGTAAAVAGGVALVAVLGALTYLGANIAGTLAADSPVEAGPALAGRAPGGLAGQVMLDEDDDENEAPPERTKAPSNETQIDDDAITGGAFGTAATGNDGLADTDSDETPPVVPVNASQSGATGAATTREQPVDRSFAGHVYRFQAFETDPNTGKTRCTRDHFNIKMGTNEEVAAHWEGRHAYIAKHTQPGLELKFISVRYGKNLTREESAEFYSEENERLTEEYGVYTNMGYPGPMYRKEIN